jgi:hypothetical protein
MEDTMAQWMWALIAVIGILLIVAIVVMVNRQRRTISLQQRFGPEYTRTVGASDDRRTAEAALEERARRRSQLTIVPLAEPVRLRYAEQWRSLQEHFVDRPVEAVDSAEHLLTRVMEDRGYPVGEFDEQADLISVDHPRVVDDYRVAHEIHRRNQAQQATTEDLREAMLRYRSLFDDLLHPGQDGRSDREADRGFDREPEGVDRSAADRAATGRDTIDPTPTTRDRDGAPADLRDAARRDNTRHDVRQEHP